MNYCYRYPHPAVTTDVVVFTIRDEQLSVLLIRRGGEPYKECWALPGGFLDIDEDLDACAARELEEETGLGDVYLEQLYTFGRPDRDPRERVITVAYYALVPIHKAKVRAASDAAETGWFPVRDLPALAFDHLQIIGTAQQRLSAKVKYSTIALQLLPEQFTLGELQQVYEIIQQENLDKRNFRKWALACGAIDESGDVRRNSGRRPAKLYRARHPHEVEILR